MQILGTAIVLSSCMMGPDYHSSKPPVLTQYTAKPLLAKTVNAPNAKKAGKAQEFEYGKAIPADWWVLFHSQAINDLIQAGLANSPNLAAAKATLREAQENVNAQIGASLYPAVTGQLSAQRERFNAASFGSSASPVIFNLFNASVNVSYTLDIFGASRREIEALRAQVDYSYYELSAAYLTLAANIVTTAITAASYQAQINATKHIIHLQDSQLTIMRKQLELGGIAGADVLTQETQVAQTRATLPPLEQSLAQSRHALAVLVGSFPSQFQMPDIQLDKLILPTKLPVTLPSSLVEKRPDIQAAEALLHAANAQIGVATANLFPQITLSGNYGWQSTAPSSLFKNSTSVWGIGGSLLQPIFNGGSLRAKQREAIAAYEAAEAQYQQVVLQAFGNVADTLRALQHDAELLRAEENAERSARNSLHVTQKQYRLGGVNYISLLDAQRQYQQTVIARIQAEATRYNDTAALFQALGGGWWHLDKA